MSLILPTHPHSGLTAIGLLRDGRPVWPVLGGSEQPPADPPQDPPQDPPVEPPADPSAEAEKWKALARKHEDRAKANATAAAELERLRRSQMSDQEKAVDAAKVQARAEVLREVGGSLVAAEVRATAAGRLSPEQIDALVDGIDATRFVDADGKVDTAKVSTFVDGLAGKPGTGGTNGKTPDMGQGRRPSSTDKPSVDAGLQRWQSRRKPVNTSTT